MFRRTGSVSCFVIEGPMPDPKTEKFAEALQAERFTSIETAASEVTSIGWVTPGDPTGETFDLADMDGEKAVWLRIRIDKKSLPATWVGIYRSSAERSRGKALGRKELRELKEDLQRKLLPRVLPSVRLIDALWVADQKRVYLFGTGKGLLEDFAKLFHRTFEAILVAVDPRTLASHLPLGADRLAYLDQVSPVRWTHGEPVADLPTPVPSRPAPASVPAEPEGEEDGDAEPEVAVVDADEEMAMEVPEEIREFGEEEAEEVPHE